MNEQEKLAKMKERYGENLNEPYYEDALIYQPKHKNLEASLRKSVILGVDYCVVIPDSKWPISVPTEVFDALFEPVGILDKEINSGPHS